MAHPDVVLHQFQASHFNEKARWGLDYKGIAHRRETYLPGPHAPLIQRLSGQTQTPVLTIDGRVVAGSANILATLEQLRPEPALYPADAERRRAALAFQERFDREVGPAVRTVVFDVLLRELDYMCRIFGRGKPWLTLTLYRAILPLARPVIAQVNGVSTPGNVERSIAVTEAALDEVARAVDATGYLVGDSFSVADLTAAALFVPLVGPNHPDTVFPDGKPESLARIHARYADHPAVRWVHALYARHRPRATA